MALRDWLAPPATLATSATDVRASGPSVATVATVAMQAPAAQGEVDRAHYRWLILQSDGGRREVCCLPEMTAAALTPCYPGAEFVPLPDAAAEASAMIFQMGA